ncbi:unnamed protein product [Fusarium fujikuroi]|uniref:Uncharacterized protein n=1 Tax=Fusarium fujikuroi TaxID=5127 RepID=A0A9Q9S0W4_FUSFU|nr:unnamed protein product [Fusarium fujikuroi]VTT82851.1 unnamed protein product [Fusarium fujikuroi]
MSDIAAMLGVNATIEAVDTKNPALAVYNHILARVVGTCLVIYIAWQYLLRIDALWNSHSEPPMLPYWIPGIGHNISFFRDVEKLLVASRSYFRTPAQPFSVLIGGRRMYVILDPRDISETHQKTKEMHFDAYIDKFMQYVSVSEKARDVLWGTTVTETSLSVPNSLRSWIRADMTGTSSRKFYDESLSELNSVMQQGSPFTTGKSNEHDMFKWTSDIIVRVSTRNFFGTALIENSPGLVDDFREFNRQTWKLLYQYPRFLSRSAYDSRDAAIEALKRYFEMPQDQRRDAAPFVIKAEDEMRKHGISNRDIAAVLFKLYWAINGNPSVFAFWLLARTLYTPHLKEDIKREVAPAFKNGISQQPDVEYLKGCPKLNATYYETMRLHSSSSSFRRIVQDTTVAGFELKAGNDVMMPYRQLHLNTKYFGESAEQFDIDRFVQNPKLHYARTYNPFGGVQFLTVKMVYGDKNAPNCQVPTGLSSLPRKDCNATILILLPFIVNHLSAIVTHLTLGNRKARNKLKFWDYNHLNGSPKEALSWTPYNTLATIAMTVVQCVVSAVAVKASGLNVSIGPLIMFYLTKPRVGWVVVMLSACFYEPLTDTATDVLFQECVLGVLALPGALMFLRVSGFGEMPDGCDTYDMYDNYAMGTNSDANLFLRSGSSSLVACGAILLFVGIAMLWKRRFLKRRLGLLAMIPCTGAFVSAWVLWICFDYAVMNGDFCISGSAIGTVSAISIIFPILNGLLRGWIGYPGGGYYPY